MTERSIDLGQPCAATDRTGEPCAVGIGEHSPASNQPYGDVYHETAGGRTWTGPESGNIAFGTGGALTGEIMVYTIPLAALHPGMTEDEASREHYALRDDDTGPEVMTYAPRGDVSLYGRTWPAHLPVWWEDGSLIRRDADGEAIDE